MKVLRYMMEEKKCYDPSEYNGLDTPLHYAASSGKEEVVQYLIVQQSAIQKEILRELHFIQHAEADGHLQVIEYLTKIANANLLWRDCKFDLTPLDLAAEHAPLNVIEYNG